MSVRTVLIGGLSSLFVLAAISRGNELEKTADPPKSEGPDIVITGQFQADGPRHRSTGMPSKMHAVKLEKDRTYVILLEGKQINPIVFVEDALGNVLAQGFNRGNDQARIRFTSPKDETYLIHGSGNAGNNEGKYTLSIKPYVAPPVKLSPLAEPTAKTASEAQGVLTGDDAPDQFRDFPGKIYTVELKAKRTYVIDMMSTQFDTYLLLQNPSGALIAQDDDSGGNLNSRIRFSPPADGRYRLVASTFNGRMGAFTIRVSEAP